MSKDKYLIDSLTPEQEALFPAYEKKYVDIGLATGPNDRKKMEETIDAVYVDAGLQPCGYHMRFGSPLSCLLAANYLKQHENKWESDPKNEVPKLVREDMPLEELISMTDGMTLNNFEACYGQYEVSWLVFYIYFQNEFPLEPCPTLKNLEILLESGWYYPMDTICFSSDRQSEIHRDDDDRLHNIDGPALAFPDGFRLYNVHGVRVPEYIIERPEEIKVESITGETNAEIRRVMMDKYGLDRFMTDSGAKLVDSDKEIGELYRSETEHDETLTMIKVINSTPESDGHHKEYWMRVSPEVTTAREAIAWMHAMDTLDGDHIPPGLYGPLVQT